MRTGYGARGGNYTRVSDTIESKNEYPKIAHGQCNVNRGNNIFFGRMQTSTTSSTRGSCGGRCGQRSKYGESASGGNCIRQTSGNRCTWRLGTEWIGAIAGG